MQSSPTGERRPVSIPVAPASTKAEPLKQPQPLDLKALGQVGGGRGLPTRGW